jgi:hypothetical protein
MGCRRLIVPQWLLLALFDAEGSQRYHYELSRAEIMPKDARIVAACLEDDSPGMVALTIESNGFPECLVDDPIPKFYWEARLARHPGARIIERSELTPITT